MTNRKQLSYFGINYPSSSRKKSINYTQSQNGYSYYTLTPTTPTSSSEMSIYTPTTSSSSSSSSRKSKYSSPPNSIAVNPSTGSAYYYPPKSSTGMQYASGSFAGYANNQYKNSLYDNQTPTKLTNCVASTHGQMRSPREPST